MGNTRHWWQVKVPPWTTAAILAGAAVWGLIIGFNWI